MDNVADQDTLDLDDEITPPSDDVPAVPPEYHLKVYADRSELSHADGGSTLFVEDVNDTATKLRYKTITTALAGGFLTEQIRLCRNEPSKSVAGQLSEDHQKMLDGLVDAMTSEVGRALIGLSVLQITVKAIEPVQSIRLHKGGNSKKNFGWRDGISMRSIDKSYITPVLRHEGLLKLNADGFMMTRTLAENYPYTRVYKAAMRGARDEWLVLVDGLETGDIAPLPALHYLISKLLNNATQFQELATATIGVLKRLISAGKADAPEAVAALLKRHMVESSYAPRIMEISMHALMQALEEVGALGSATVIPLSQMRSANKKHGNIGDVELEEGGKIIEAWDAKFGKTYLRDELEELNDKLGSHDGLVDAGFVTSDTPTLSPPIVERIDELKDAHDVGISILTFDEWVGRQVARAADFATPADIAHRSLIAYTESLAQMRTDKAPIDEPCFQWLTTLRAIMESELGVASPQAATAPATT